jgi:hypothetical protein
MTTTARPKLTLEDLRVESFVTTPDTAMVDGVIGMSDCGVCTDCTNCTGCSSCSGCSDCTGCSNWS